jgi:hypothetical protein
VKAKNAVSGVLALGDASALDKKAISGDLREVRRHET